MGKRSLKSFFIRNLLAVSIWSGLFVLITIGSILLLMLTPVEKSMTNSFIRRADYLEKKLPKVVDQINGSSSVGNIEIPEDYRYYLRSEKKKKVSGNMTVGEVQIAEETLKKETKASRFNKVMEKKETRYGTLFVSYYLMSDFNSPFLRKLLPPVEVLELLLLIISYISGLMVISSYYSNKVTRELKKISYTTTQVKELNLDFKDQESMIKEVNAILMAMDQMKNSLKQSLEKQWESEETLNFSLQALSHDLKTPLTVIKGNTELLELTDLTAEQADYLAYLSQHVTRLETYMEDLEHLAYPVEEIVTQQLVAVRVLIDEINVLVASLMEPKAYNLEVRQGHNYQFEDYYVRISMKSFNRSIQNILSNAIRFNSEGELIVIEIQLTEKMFSVSIKDKGPGFSPMALAKGTQRFYTEDTSRQGIHYGLGLAITTQLIQQAGGQLLLANYEREDGKKSAEVMVCLPLVVVTNH